MKFSRRSSFFSFISSFLALLAHDPARAQMPLAALEPLPATVSAENTAVPEVQNLTFLSTNDFHGAAEPALNRFNRIQGGIAVYGGIVKAIREAAAAETPPRGVIVTDAGDQFQGRLISNINEGRLMFRALQRVGMDAIIPGNHDYDFGPEGWLQDRADPNAPTAAGRNPRGIIEELAGSVRDSFPMLSANTFLRNSMVDAVGVPVEVNSLCVPTNPGLRINWSHAQRPSFLQGHKIFVRNGVRIAVIGIDTTSTPTTTTPENVSDLCFVDEVRAYLSQRHQLDQLADVFVMLIHAGDTSSDFPLLQMIRRIRAYETKNPIYRGRHIVDVVLAGHTHFIEDKNIDGIPIVQAASSGQYFARIDLTVTRESPQSRWQVQREVPARPELAKYWVLPVSETQCGSRAPASCRVVNGRAQWGGVEVRPIQAIVEDIAQVRQGIGAIASRVVAHSDGRLARDRILESPLANALTDTVRQMTQTQFAFVNTGGIRTDLPAGTITYEQLFSVFPFNNHILRVGPMSWPVVKAALENSIRTCGEHGALMQSGLRVRYSRNCPSQAAGAQLIDVALADGTVLMSGGQESPAAVGLTFNVALLDFLASGGSGYSMFAGVPVQLDYGILREEMTTYLLRSPPTWSSQVDGRWTLVVPTP